MMHVHYAQQCYYGIYTKNIYANKTVHTILTKSKIIIILQCSCSPSAIPIRVNCLVSLFCLFPLFLYAFSVCSFLFSVFIEGITFLMRSDKQQKWVSLFGFIFCFHFFFVVAALTAMKSKHQRRKVRCEQNYTRIQFFQCKNEVFCRKQSFHYFGFYKLDFCLKKCSNV